MLKNYDVVIAGGGIQGCAIAQACAAAGFATLLLEKDRFGYATSSRSSKLIHGGLRYLQTGQFSLVRECIDEREWMFRQLPDLVKPNWFYLPVYRHSHVRPWQLYSGLSLYRMLGGFNPHSKFRRLPKKQWRKLAGLDTRDLQAVFAYQDGQTDDRQLTLRVQQSADKLGAVCMEQARLNRAARFDDGFQVCFRHDDGETCVKAAMLINAAGPWVNHVLACISPSVEPVAIDLVQGTHIVLEQQLSEQCFYLEAPADQRAVFILPWQGKTLVGTTETDYHGEPDECRPLDSEVDYLLATIKHYFPDHPLKVVDSFSGLRVLPKSDQRAFFRSRDVQLQQDGRLLTVYGGKLTSWRATGSEVLAAVENTLGKRQPVDTRRLAV